MTRSNSPLVSACPAGGPREIYFAHIAKGKVTVLNVVIFHNEVEAEMCKDDRSKWLSKLDSN